MSENLVTRSSALSIQQQKDQQSDQPDENLVFSFPFSSEEPYLRSNWFDAPWVEVLGHNDSEVDLTRLNSGAPVLLNHGYTETENAPVRSVGITTKAWLENGRGYVEVKMSRRDGMQSLIQDIQDGIIKNVSVGYKILERTLTNESADTPSEYRVTRWLPLEVTLCDIPADATVGIGRSILNHEDNIVTKQNAPEVEQAATQEQVNQRAVEIQPTVNVEQIRKEALEAERKRASEIKTICRSVSLGDDISDALIERGVTVDDARKEVLEVLAKRTETGKISSKADIFTVRDETETRHEMMQESLLHRANPQHKLPEGARQFAGLSLIELAKESLSAKGVNTRGLDRMQVATRAFQGSSDFSNLLANVANKSLRQAYEAAPRTFTPWARQTTAPDFKSISRVMMSDAPALTSVTENGEFTRGTVTDGKETYQLATVGKIIGITRQAIINDDLSAFTRIPALFAAAAANYESDTVYGILTANAALSDSVALFHANHNNYTGTGTAISVTSLGVARTLMRKQTTPKGAVMNLRPRYLIVPAALETIAAQYVSQNYIAAKSSDYNPFAGALEVIAEARLDANSATAWYLAADTAQIDTVEYCYLEGQNGVYIETRTGFDTDGMEIKARLDFAAKAIEYRGLYKNVGA